MSEEDGEVRIEIAVQNVKCGGCVSAIQDALRDVTGVSSVEVDVPTGRVTVETDRELASELAEALTRIGYPPRA